MPPPTALLVPGAGSTPDFLHRTFAAPLAGLGLSLATVDHRDGTAGEAVPRLAEEVARLRPVLLGGVSHGAHLAARTVAAGVPGVRALLAVMPAWTGAPGPVAGITAATAARVRLEGVEPLLDELDAGLAPDDPRAWVVAELRRGWSRWHPVALAEHLDAVAAGPGPTPAELASVTVPTALVALAEDPLHPAAVVTDWAAVLPRAAVTTVALGAPAQDQQALGLAAARLLEQVAPGLRG